MATPILVEVEDKILELLGPLQKAEGGYLLTLRANDRDLDVLLEQGEVVQFPAIIVQWIGGPLDERGRSTGGSQRFGIILADANRRGAEAQRRGGGVVSEGPGTFQMAEDVHEKLRHQCLTAGSTWSWTGYEEVGSDRRMTVVLMTLEVDLQEALHCGFFSLEL